MGLLDRGELHLVRLEPPATDHQTPSPQNPFGSGGAAYGSGTAVSSG